MMRGEASRLDNPRAFACINEHIKQDGMSLRDYYAGQAMLGMLGSGTNWHDFYRKSHTGIAFQIADAMLKSRTQINEH